MQYLDAVLKMTEWSVCFQGKPFSITVIQVYAPASIAEEAEAEWFYEDLQDCLELTPKKDVLFIIADWNAILGRNLKNNRMMSVHSQSKPFNTTVIQVYAPTSNAEEAEAEWFYEDLQDLLELTPKKDVLFIIGAGMQK